jgi:hypothetical protein
MHAGPPGKTDRMAPIDIDSALAWRGRTVLDRDGEPIGKLKEIYLDEEDRPSWGSVHTGLFGLRETLVPLAAVQAEDDDRLRVPFARDHVKDAPNVDPDVQLDPEEERVLYRHYDLDDRPTDEGEPAAEADDAMTRSEEEVRFGTRRRARERVRLKKYVVTDYVEKKVPVRREEIRVEHEPADGDAGGS